MPLEGQAKLDYMKRYYASLTPEQKEKRRINNARRARERYAHDPEHRQRLADKQRLIPAIVKRAHARVRYAVKMGLLVKPKTCDDCGCSNKPLDAAHEDYSRPLEIRWLCKTCHRIWDMKRPKTRELVT